MKLILGFMHHTHDASAVLLDENGFVAAIEEERVNRDKHTSFFPNGAIKACLKSGRVNSNQITHIAYPWNPYMRLFYGLYFTAKYFPKSLRVIARRGDGDFFQILKMEDRLKRYGNENGLKFNYKKFYFIDHHLSHASYAYFTSRFEESLIYTHDFCGEYHSILIAKGEGNKIIPIKRIAYPNSLGFIFNAITKYLGFRRNSDEGKVMGLAPYGDDRYFDDFKKIVKLLPDGEFKINEKYFDIFFYDLKNGGESPLVSELFIKKFGMPRNGDEELNESHKAIASALQNLLNMVNEHIISYFMKKYNMKNLVAAGGVFLNSCSNGYILERGLVENLHIPPAAGDNGASSGAALYVKNVILGKKNRVSANPYLGTYYSDYFIEKALVKSGLKYRKSDDIVKECVENLLENKVIGWFQGRMEYGPRALGSRSILASPVEPWMRDYLNNEIKHRELFRPYAPSICLENFEEYFYGSGESPYMLKVFKAREEKVSKIPSVIHVDGTARVQTVSKKDNPLYYRLIKEFGNRSGVPVLLNTSFNDRGEPIVEKPEDGINFFKKSKIDILCIGNFIVSRQNNENR